MSQERHNAGDREDGRGQPERIEIDLGEDHAPILPHRITRP
jgi:hypothetical protein